jgi:predicted MPP superfamily phosphohydrolase
VFISDTHLGNSICQYEKLLEFLKSFETEDGHGYNLKKLYLNGDILDLTQFNHKVFWSKHRSIIKKLLRMADKGVQIVYIKGNHDYHIQEIIKDTEVNYGFNGILGNNLDLCYYGASSLNRKKIASIGATKTWENCTEVFKNSMVPVKQGKIMTKTMYDAFIGQPLEVLKEALERDGKTIRIVQLNGNPAVVTMDLNINRLNVGVTNNIVDLIRGFG